MADGGVPDRYQHIEPLMSPAVALGAIKRITGGLTRNMALDVAFSIEAGDFVDPDRAYDLFWAGVITNKRAFVCPGADCAAQVTCANLDKDVQSMRVVPHFKVYGEHSEACGISNGKAIDLEVEPSGPDGQERKTVDESIVDVFKLDRPDSYYDEPTQDPSADVHLAKQRARNTRPYTTKLGESGIVGPIYSVRSVVSRYIRYRSDNTLEFRRLNIAGQDVAYDSIFKCIWEQDLTDLPDHPVIYYGWAYIDRTRKNDAYRIKFKKCLMRGTESLTTSSFVSDALIERYKLKNLMATRLSKISQQPKPTAFVFLYAQPTVRTSQGTSYANFELKNLDMVDVNYDCPLPSKYDK